jgi:glyoxylase-like metal-dependent hydrolase (beta-lactamase superfamily II)
MYNHSIEPILLSKFEGPMPFFTHLMNFDKRFKACSYIFSIRGPKENIIVDCGGLAENAKPPIPGFAANDICSPEEGLEKVGLKCSDIDSVILTQLHPDHIEFARKYENARFIIQKNELDFGFSPHESFAFAYVKELYKDLNFEVIEGDKEIVEGVSVLYTPGHSPGGQSVMVDTNKGRAIITGFCCIRENFEPPEAVREIMPFILPSIMTNAFQLYDSMKRVKELADIVIPLHGADIADNEMIP